MSIKEQIEWIVEICREGEKLAEKNTGSELDAQSMAHLFSLIIDIIEAKEER